MKLKKEENSTELQKPNIEGEVYNNNKNVTVAGRKKLKSLIRFHRANKIDHYNRGRGEVIKRKKNPKESTEQVKA